MTEEIRYNKDEKWTPYEQLAETPQQTIDRLEQENKTLKANASVIQEYITKNEQLKTNIDSLAKKCCKYKSALEEINLILDELKQQYDYMTDYSEIKEIQEKINEVLGND